MHILIDRCAAVGPIPTALRATSPIRVQDLGDLVFGLRELAVMVLATVLTATTVATAKTANAKIKRR